MRSSASRILNRYQLFATLVLILLSTSFLPVVVNVAPAVHAQSSSSLFTLPAGAYTPSFVVSNEVTLLSADSQSKTLAPGESASFTVTYDVHAGSNPSQITQAFFVVSWTPSWPPSTGYYFPMYNGMPGLAPGINQTQTLTVTVPSTPGTYYIWFLMGSFDSMQDAVNSYTSEPPLPAHLEVTTLEGTLWNSTTPLPLPVSHLGVVVTSTNVYSIGGD